uniref:Uncharacterized protein n=1 Tax=Setaria italica TaxID=4555 RepID=K3XUH0_SETIT
MTNAEERPGPERYCRLRARRPRPYFFIPVLIPFCANIDASSSRFACFGCAATATWRSRWLARWASCLTALLAGILNDAGNTDLATAST